MKTEYLFSYKNVHQIFRMSEVLVDRANQSNYEIKFHYNAKTNKKHAEITTIVLFSE
jgi:hypothetical protein